MNPQLPHNLDKALSACAARLGRGLEKIEPVESRTGTPCHEINAVLNLMHELGSASFATYATSTLANRGRVDLVAICGRAAVAVIAADESGSALHKLKGFRPSLEEVAGDGEAQAQWDLAAERWSVVVTTRYADVVARDQWLAGDHTHSSIRGAACVTDDKAGRGHSESWLFWEAQPNG